MRVQIPDVASLIPATLAPLAINSVGATLVVALAQYRLA